MLHHHAEPQLVELRSHSSWLLWLLLLEVSWLRRHAAVRETLLARMKLLGWLLCLLLCELLVL